MVDKHEAFCREYIIDLNKTQAAIRSGYSAKTANAAGTRLYRNVQIQERIQELMDLRSIRTRITADKVLQELSKLAFSNMGDYVRLTSDGEPYVDLGGITRDQFAAVTEATVEDVVENRGDDQRTIRKVKIKLADKRQSLEAIGKHLGMFVERHQAIGVDNRPIILVSNGRQNVQINVPVAIEESNGPEPIEPEPDR